MTKIYLLIKTRLHHKSRTLEFYTFVHLVFWVFFLDFSKVPLCVSGQTLFLKRPVRLRRSSPAMLRSMFCECFKVEADRRGLAGRRVQPCVKKKVCFWRDFLCLPEQSGTQLLMMRSPAVLAGRGGGEGGMGTNSAQLLGGVEERDDVTAPVLLISGRGWRSWGSSRGRVGVVARPPPPTVRCDAKLKEKQRSRIRSVFFLPF